MRTTTEKPWPKLEVLPEGSGELAVNPLVALDELAKSEFPKTAQFAEATAVMMQAEPRTASADRSAVAAVSPGDFVPLWKTGLQSAYRYWHNHPCPARLAAFFSGERGCTVLLNDYDSA